MSFSNKPVPALGALLALVLLSSSSAAAAAPTNSGWSLNFTPTLISEDGYDFGGGVDPEVKYTLDLGGARLSSGARVGAFYARNLFGVMVMPTVRLAAPMGAFEPYTSFGVGYGRVTQTGHGDMAAMSRVGFVYRFTEKLAMGVEGTIQKIEGSDFRFPSLGSLFSYEL